MKRVVISAAVGVCLATAGWWWFGFDGKRQIALFSADGTRLFRSALAESPSPTLVITLLSNMETQQTLLTCGVASTIMALNALLNSETTQASFWTPCVERCISRDQHGLTLDELFYTLETCWGDQVGITKTYAADSTLSAFERVFSQPNLVVLSNFDRRVLHQKGNGHWSPIVTKSQKWVLVADVAPFKYEPYWVLSKTMFDAMKTMDKSSGKSRGWIVLCKKNKK